jgi:signal transduction histidine kinase
VAALMVDGRLDDATARFGTDAQPLMARAEAAASAIATAIDRETAAQVLRADRLTAAAVTATIAALVLAILVALALAVAAPHLLTRPLDRLSGSMKTVAHGHFEPPDDLPYDQDDEVGELARSFRAMTLRLADLDRMKAEFVGVASHDLKTPINVISGYAEMLEEELGAGLDRRHRDLLIALAAQARTLGQRLDQLLDISRMEASGLQLGLEEISLRHFTAGLEKAHTAAATRHGVALSTAVAESAPSFLIADPDCLQVEVLGNLLDHAFRFTPAGGRVHLHVSGDGGTVRFEVRDTGRPIPPDDLRFVFDRYYQGRGLGRAGSGLGLPIARAGARAHGGDIEVESGDGETIFRLTLPIRPTLPRGIEDPGAVRRPGVAS